MIRFVCECGKQLQVREENAGKRVACPVCGRQQTVPAVGADAIQAVEEDIQPAAAGRPARPALAPDFEEEPTADAPTGTSGKATASLVLGICSLFCNILTGIPALILGLLALRDIGRSRERLGGRGLAIAGISTACAGTLLSCIGLIPTLLLVPAVQKAREAVVRVQSANNLKQMGLAMHNYNATYNTFPPSAIGDPLQPPKARKPRLSWRVALLPFVEEQILYNQFKLDEPWDGPNNIKLLTRMPKVYQLPNDDQTPPDHTHYQVFVGNGAAFEKTSGLPLGEFKDGISNTILIVEAAQAVPWTKPDDIAFDPNKPIAPRLSTHFRSGFNVLLADGSVRSLPANTPEATLKALITRDANDVVNWP